MRKSKNRYFHVPQPTFLFTLETPLRLSRKSCMDRKTIRCLPNPSQHIPIYLQQFPSYTMLKSMRKSKNRYFHVQSPHFCFPWRRPCDYHAICCMDVKTIQCLPNPSQHVPIYLQQFPSYSNRKCQKLPFSRMAAHIFISPGDAPATRNMLHGWKDNLMLAKPLAVCTDLSSIVSELYDA